MKLVLSTSNIMSGGQSVIRRPTVSKSNVELINSFRANFSPSSSLPPQASPSSSRPSSPSLKTPPSSIPSWTTKEGDILYVPSYTPTPLVEPRDSYSITVKLFFLPAVPTSRRCTHTRDAISFVLSELGVSSIDLLIISFPGVSFDADDDAGEDEEDEEGEPLSHSSPDSSSSAAPSLGGTAEEDPEGLESQVKTWRVLESLHGEGMINQLGVSEFSSERLAKFLPPLQVRPTVDQINVKDCCVVPRPLIMYAKEHQIELLTHNDCTDILPVGTLRELLGPGEQGAGVLASSSNADEEAGDGRKLLKGDIEPQWVIKYTAVVKNRGVIENKGYFAMAQLGNCIESRD